MKESCTICPRACGAERSYTAGYCGAGDIPRVARAALHFYEEPPISGENGSGAVFFSGCNMRCIFCQNMNISASLMGEYCDAPRLSELFLRLQDKGAHNINLVTPTIHLYTICQAITLAKQNGLVIPVVYNTSAYETVESIQALHGLVDIYLPDLKYVSPALSAKFSATPDYFSFAAAAINEMQRQVGTLAIDINGIATRGLLIRHLVLPGCLFDTRAVLNHIYEHVSPDTHVSLMRQYTPLSPRLPPPFDRRLTWGEYKRAQDHCLTIGLKNVFIQDKESASDVFIPSFSNDLTNS